jgi:hypothetical protein
MKRRKRLLKKLLRDTENSLAWQHSGDTGRDLVPDAMKVEAARLAVQSGKHPQPHQGACHHAAGDHDSYRY